jgi:hypothetical protein
MGCCYGRASKNCAVSASPRCHALHASPLYRARSRRLSIVDRGVVVTTRVWNWSRKCQTQRRVRYANPWRAFAQREMGTRLRVNVAASTLLRALRNLYFGRNRYKIAVPLADGSGGKMRWA